MGATRAPWGRGAFRPVAAAAGVVVALGALTGALLRRPAVVVERGTEPPAELLVVGRVAVGPAAAGLEVTGLRRDDTGTELHLQYRVRDPHRAAIVLGDGPAYVLVPDGSRLQPAAFEPPLAELGGTGQVRFADPGARVPPGTRVTVVVGAMAAPGLVVAPPAVRTVVLDEVPAPPPPAEPML